MIDAVPLAVVYWLCTLVALSLCVRTVRSPESASAELTGLAASIGVWAFFYGLEVLSQSLRYRLLWSQLAYVGTYGTGAFLLRFAVRWLRPRLAGAWMELLWIVPVVMVMTAFTNEWHGLLWPVIEPSQEIPFIWYYGRGPMFWVGSLYQYVLVAASMVVLIAGAVERTGIYRRQTTLVLVGVAVGMVGNLLYLFRAFPELPLDVTPFSLALATGFLLAGVSSARLLELLPTARDRVVELMPGGLIVLDSDLRVIDWNRAAVTMWGLERRNLVGTPADQIIPGWDSVVPAELPDELTVALEQGDESSVCHHIDLELRRFASEAGRTYGWIALFHDNTELRATELRLQEANHQLESLNKELLLQAVHDGLTGLFNRNYLDEALPRELARARRSGTPVSLLIMDIDLFKQINDSHGHEVGDQVLIGVANVVRRLLRAGDVPCRFGGDELVAIMPGATTADAVHVAERIRNAVESATFGPPDAQVSVTVSIGYAIYPDHAETAADLFRQADRALYGAKDGGRNRAHGAAP